MARKVKCPYCEEMVDKEEAISHQKRYYHDACLKEKEKSTQHRRELIEYICDLYKVDAPTGMMLKQIKEFENDFKYKLKGIELALRYFYDTLENNPREGEGIGIVPYVYEEAKRHYLKRQSIQKSVNKLTENPVKEKRVRVKSPKLEIQRRNLKIDMNSL
ncbi:hypothetical protein [Priestia megaterium]|uniref:hypothetical protein n=1 Tax=Priestia megaterium TaxID=1404 RepID=UPI003CC63897